MVIGLIYQSIVSVHVKVIPFVCPSNCKCKGQKIHTCAIDSITQFSEVGRIGKIDELLVTTCNEWDFNSLSTEGRFYPITQMRCDELVSKNKKQHYNCVYNSKSSSSSDNCVNICSTLNTAQSQKSVKCICYNCLDDKTPLVSIRARRNAQNTTNNAPSVKPSASNKTSTNKNEPRETFVIVIIAAISVAAFLINFVVMVKLCCSPLTVIDLFGTALMLFNVLLSIYGMSMALFEFNPSLGNTPTYCQFFTSIKLFSLGSALYTLTLLVFHHPIRRSVDDNLERGGEKEEKESEKKKRDAIFKGIVFILEGVMLAGVLGVLSWIKFQNWNKYGLCSIIDPKGSVEELLFGIEMWYYVLSGLLVGWYFGNYLYRLYVKFKAMRDNIKRKKNGDEEEEIKNVTPYIIRDFPIFVMVSLSFSIWIGGHFIIKPNYGKMAALIRVCSLLLPLIIQPFIYIIRNTCCCQCCTSVKRRLNTSEEMKLECKCSGECTCNNCEMDEVSQLKNNNVEVTRFGTSGVLSKGKIDEEDEASSDSDEDHDKDDETTALNKKTGKRKNTYDIPKVVCRSPVQSEKYTPISDESTHLLDDMDGKKPPTPTPTIVINDEDASTDSTKPMDTIDEADEGRVSRGPTFYPYAEKETETLIREVDLKNEIPSKDESIKLNNDRVDGKQKRKDPNNEKNNNKQKIDSSQTNSTTSLESDNTFSRSDSSVSQESASRAEEPLTDTTSDKEEKAGEGNTKHSELNVHLNNDCDENASGENESLLNSSNSSSPSEEISSGTTFNNTHDSGPQDVFNKVQYHPNECEVNSNHTNSKIRTPLLASNDDGTIER